MREFITRFQSDPTAHSINYEPIHRVRDERVRTVRIGPAYRAIVLHPQKGDTYLLACSGQRGAALEQYETCCQLLSEELDIEPTEETVALCERIRAGELEAPAPFCPS